MTASSSLPLSPLPESLVTHIKNLASIRLHATMLGLDYLRARIENGQEEALSQQWLHREEQGKLQTLRHKKRHLEWLGGRICVKEAALLYLHGNSSALAAPSLQIMTAASGRPFLAPGSLPAEINMPHISISHSRGYALAVAASVPCGVDIQADSDSLLRVQDRFCTQSEEELLGRHLYELPLSKRLTLLWAAKEAIKKSAAFDPMPGFLDLTLTHIQTTARDGLMSPEPGPESSLRFAYLAEGRPTTTDGLVSLFFLDYHDHRKGSPPPQSPIQVSVCRCQGYGIALCTLPAQSCIEAHHA